MKRMYRVPLSFLCLSFVLANCTPGSNKAQVIHVELERQDGEMVSSGYSFTSDEARVSQELEKYQPRLPDPLPDEAVILYCPAGPFFGIMQKRPDKPGVRLTLDVNTNHDLTDDGTLELPTVENWQDGITIQIARTYETPEQHSELLPYRIGHQVHEGREGQQEDMIFICSDYIFEGTFLLKDTEYSVKLVDGDVRGRFIKDKVVNVFLYLGRSSEMDTPGKVKAYRPFELVTIGDRLFEIRDIAEDGSWLEIMESDLPTVRLGEQVPDMEMTDMEDQTFRLSDYRGKVLLLDFWPVWCKPCVAKFPDIKRMIEEYADRPFAVIGINIDDARRVEEAEKVIAEYELNWRQVVEGKGEFIPSYQVLGRLPEREMSFPVYILIDEEGIARYATNDYLKMERFLKVHFSVAENDRDVRFIPLTEQYTEQSPVEYPVDFTSEKVEALKGDTDIKRPVEMPEKARLGLLPNGTLLLAYPASEGERLHVILDSNRDFDLTNDEGSDIPILTGPVTDELAVRISLTISYASGGMGFRPVHMFARPVQNGEAGSFPEVYYRGMSQTFRGSFFEGRTEYEIVIHDPTGDYLLTKEDTTDPTILTLRRKKKTEWVPVYEGIDSIPIGRNLYRIRRISDDGELIELELSR